MSGLALKEREFAPMQQFIQYLKQVRQEAAKVTWPTRKETMVSTAMVFVMVILAALFFFLVDQVLAFGVRLILGLGS